MTYLPVDSISNMEYSDSPVDRYTESDASTLPSLHDEWERTLSSIILEQEPTTVTHLLLTERNSPMTKEAIAARIGRKSFEIEGTLALLEERGWVVRFPENGLEKYIVQAVRRGVRTRTS